MLSPGIRQVIHALLTRPPLRQIMIWSKPHRQFVSVRLACVKHAASVHPEPGSNSHVVITQCMLLSCISKTCVCPVKINLAISSANFSRFLSDKMFPSVFWKTLLFLGCSLNFLWSSHPLGWSSVLEFSGLHYCLFVKVPAAFVTAFCLCFSSATKMSISLVI